MGSTIEVRLPKLGMTMSEGEVSQWLVADGESVTEGSPLYVLSTDKVDQEIPSPAAGVVRHLIAAGTTCPVGTPLAHIDA